VQEGGGGKEESDINPKTVTGSEVCAEVRLRCLTRPVRDCMLGRASLFWVPSSDTGFRGCISRVRDPKTVRGNRICPSRVFDRQDEEGDRGGGCVLAVVARCGQGGPHLPCHGGHAGHDFVLLRAWRRAARGRDATGRTRPRVPTITGVT
jgi:hypothetical protein